VVKNNNNKKKKKKKKKKIKKKKKKKKKRENFHNIKVNNYLKYFFLIYERYVISM